MSATTPGRQRCPMDGCTFDPTTDYAGKDYPDARTRRHYCRDACRLAGAREHERRRWASSASAQRRRALAALEAAGQLTLEAVGAR